MKIIAWYSPGKRIRIALKTVRLLSFAAVPLVGDFAGDFYGVFNEFGHICLDPSYPAWVDLDYENRPLVERYKEFLDTSNSGVYFGKVVLVLSLARLFQRAVFPYA